MDFHPAPCIYCGGQMLGDNYSEPLRCEYLSELPEGAEPDSGPYFCNPDEEAAP